VRRIDTISAETDRLLGQCVRQERLLAGQGRAALASALGISERRLEEYEAGRRRMPPAAMVRASEALGLPLSVLFFDDGAAADPMLIDETPPRLAVARPLGLVGRGPFASLAPFLDLWRSSRGRLPADIGDFVARAGLLHRTVFARRAPQSSRLVVEHLGAGIEMFRPCESLLLVGRDIAELTDGDYGAWVADTYARTLADEQPVLEAVRATIRVMEDRLIEGRYDRFLLPWLGAGGERFVLCISLTRSSRVLAPAAV
jgi:transcriptional regulator with XRE-family HTH domain